MLFVRAIHLSSPPSRFTDWGSRKIRSIFLEGHEPV
jgi:hypothetical protein